MYNQKTKRTHKHKRAAAPLKENCITITPPWAEVIKLDNPGCPNCSSENLIMRDDEFNNGWQGKQLECCDCQLRWEYNNASGSSMSII